MLGMISLSSPDTKKRTEFIPSTLILTTLKYQEKKKNKQNTQQRMKRENGIKEKKQVKDIGTLDSSTVPYYTEGAFCTVLQC